MLIRFTPPIKGTMTMLLSVGKLQLSAGFNDVDDDFWAKAKDTPEVKAKIKEGVIVPMGDTSPEVGRININTGTKTELVDLPGIGPATANRLIAGRPYKDMEAVKEVAKLSESDWNQVVPLIDV